MSPKMSVSVCWNFYKKLYQKQHRDDYLEWLELAVIFLISDSQREVSFRIHLDASHARSMSKGDYAYKIYLFKD